MLRDTGPDPAERPRQLTPRNLAVAFAIAAVALWLLSQTVGAILLIALIAVVAVVLNAPVAWLERHGWNRSLATAAVMLVTFGLIAGIFFLIVPRIAEQASELVNALPDLIAGFKQNVGPALSDLLGVDEAFGSKGLNPSSLMDSVPSVLGRLGSLTMSFVGGLVIFVLVVTTVVYILLTPRPIAAFLLRVFPERHRDRAEQAFVRSRESIVAWMTSNVIVGAGEAVAASIFLTMMGVPGALIWGGLAFFSELIPNLGAYLMAIPPILVAFAVDPMTALWTALFYIAMQNVGSATIAPKIRASRMNIHPAFLLLVLLVMTSAFGFLGAVLSTPAAGLISAFANEFWLERSDGVDPESESVEEVLALEERDKG